MQRGNTFYGSDISKVSALRNFPRADRRPTVKGDIQLLGIGIAWKNMIFSCWELEYHRQILHSVIGN